MRKRTYTLIKETCQLLTIIGAVITLSLGFYALSRILKPKPREAIEDEIQIDEMRNYHQSEGRSNVLFF